MNCRLKRGSLSLTREGGDHRLHDNSPGSDIPSRVNVRVCSESAGRTEEFGLRLPVRFIDHAADRTGPAGVARVNQDDRNTRCLKISGFLGGTP